MMTVFDLLEYETQNGTQRSCGVLYAMCFLVAGNNPEDPEFQSRCQKANVAIINRWSMNGLARVKAIAWKIAEAGAARA